MKLKDYGKCDEVLANEIEVMKCCIVYADGDEIYDLFVYTAYRGMFGGVYDELLDSEVDSVIDRSDIGGCKIAFLLKYE